SWSAAATMPRNPVRGPKGASGSVMAPGISRARRSGGVPTVLPMGPGCPTARSAEQGDARFGTAPPGYLFSWTESPGASSGVSHDRCSSGGLGASIHRCEEVAMATPKPKEAVLSTAEKDRLPATEFAFAKARKEPLTD